MSALPVVPSTTRAASTPSAKRPPKRPAADGSRGGWPAGRPAMSPWDRPGRRRCRWMPNRPMRQGRGAARDGDRPLATTNAGRRAPHPERPGSASADERARGAALVGVVSVDATRCGLRRPGDRFVAEQIDDFSASSSSGGRFATVSLWTPLAAGKPPAHAPVSPRTDRASPARRAAVLSAPSARGAGDSVRTSSRSGSLNRASPVRWWNAHLLERDLGARA